MRRTTVARQRRTRNDGRREHDTWQDAAYWRTHARKLRRRPVRAAATNRISDQRVKARETKQRSKAARPLTERASGTTDEREPDERLIVERTENCRAGQSTNIGPSRRQDNRWPNARRITQIHVRHVETRKLRRVVDLDTAICRGMEEQLDVIVQANVEA